MNRDGAPGTVCNSYHLDGGRIADVTCDACEDSRCEDCGSVVRLEPHAHGCSKGGRTVEARA